MREVQTWQFYQATVFAVCAQPGSTELMSIPIPCVSAASTRVTTLIEAFVVASFDHDSGVVDEDVETPEIAPDPVDALADTLVAGDVELSRFDGKTRGDQCSGRSTSFAGITRSEDYADPMLRELSTYLQADSPVGSGNQRNFLFSHSLYPVVNHLSR